MLGRSATLVMPAENKKDWVELDDFMREGVEVHFVSRIEEVVDVVFSEWMQAHPLAQAMQVTEGKVGQSAVDSASS